MVVRVRAVEAGLVASVARGMGPLPSSMAALTAAAVHVVVPAGAEPAPHSRAATGAQQMESTPPHLAGAPPGTTRAAPATPQVGMAHHGGRLHHPLGAAPVLPAPATVGAHAVCMTPMTTLTPTTGHRCVSTMATITSITAATMHHTLAPATCNPEAAVQVSHPHHQRGHHMVTTTTVVDTTSCLQHELRSIILASGYGHLHTV